MWAGYRLGGAEAAWTVAGCILAHVVANLGQHPHLADYYLQDVFEALLLAIVAYGARAQRISHDDLVASRELTAQVHSVLRDHLERAREVQSELLGEPPLHLEPYEMGLKFEVAVELGGDVFFVCQVPDGVLLFVGDVSGKGPKAALAATSIRVLLSGIVRETCCPGRVLSILQQRFLELFPAGLFITAFCAFANSAEECLVYSNAGHDPPLVRRAHRAVLEELSGQALPVGVDAAETFSEARVAFGPGDRLLVYTDGLIDARQPDGERLGVEPVEQLLRTFAGGSQQLAQGLVQLAPAPRHDDVMVLVLHFQSTRLQRLSLADPG